MYVRQSVRHQPSFRLLHFYYMSRRHNNSLEPDSYRDVVHSICINSPSTLEFRGDGIITS
jgi:hypothetical protein